MKNKDKLIAIINKISKRENKHPEIVVSELNNMSEEELNKKLRTMDIFKDGGKIDYLLCLKKGGKTKKCRCGNEIKKAQLGDIVKKQSGGNLAQTVLSNMGVYQDPSLNQALLNRGTVTPKADIPSN
jgi:hypothetical protein